VSDKASMHVSGSLPVCTGRSFVGEVLMQRGSDVQWFKWSLAWHGMAVGTYVWWSWDTFWDLAQAVGLLWWLGVHFRIRCSDRCPSIGDEMTLQPRLYTCLRSTHSGRHHHRIGHLLPLPCRRI